MAAAILCLFLVVGSAAPAAAWTLEERTALKTLTYEVMHNAFDLTLYNTVLEGTLAGSPVFLGVNAALSAAVYYTHDYVWETVQPATVPFSDWTTFYKLVTFRAATTVKNIGIGLLFTGDPTIATGFAIASAIADTGFFLGNEWAWGAWVPPDEVLPVETRVAARN
jgi:uncharacterized membrane protein